LLFRESRSFHSVRPFKGRTLAPRGGNSQGHVKTGLITRLKPCVELRLVPAALGFVDHRSQIDQVVVAVVFGTFHNILHQFGLIAMMFMAREGCDSGRAPWNLIIWESGDN
ncbi:hypothetical protein, partial [Brevundimonas diminuta]